MACWPDPVPPLPPPPAFFSFFPGNIWRICLGEHIEKGKILDLGIVSRHYKLSHNEIEAAIFPVNSMTVLVKKKERIVKQISGFP